MTMNIPEPPTAEEALKHLAPVIPLIYAGLEAGALEVRGFFGERHQAIDDAALAAHLLRWRAKHHIDEMGAGLSVEFERENLANSGLSVRFDGYHVRVRKAVEGYDQEGDLVPMAPIPGPSARLQSFYGQQMSLPGIEDSAETMLNLLLLWQVTGDYRLTGLTLACPRSGGITRESVRMYWEHPVPHPAFSMESHPEPSNDDDLPYKTEDESEGERGISGS
jgi:hypothetical protein